MHFQRFGVSEYVDLLIKIDTFNTFSNIRNEDKKCIVT